MPILPPTGRCANLHFGTLLPVTELSKESQMLLAEINAGLPPGFSPIDQALAIAGYRDNVKEDKAIAGIHVLTIHGSKGREFDDVYLIGWEDEIIPGRNNSPKEIEEERRLAYVAITRARNFVAISSAQTRNTPWGAVAQHSPSRFIAELEVAT